MIEKKCKICGKKFSVFYDRDTRHRLYCDNCRYRKCLICQELFLIKPKAKKASKFCSKKCCNEQQKGRKIPRDIVKKMADAHKGRKTGKFITCLECGKIKYKYPRDIKRVKNSFCSVSCWLKYKKKNASPKRNNKEKEKEWKKQVYKNDDYTCWICEKWGGKLNAHHLRGWAKYPELRFDLNNGITLCVWCHRIYTIFGNQYSQNGC